MASTIMRNAITRMAIRRGMRVGAAFAAASAMMIAGMSVAPVANANAGDAAAAAAAQVQAAPAFKGLGFTVTSANGEGKPINPGAKVTIAADANAGFPKNATLRIDLASTTGNDQSSTYATPLDGVESSADVKSWATATTGADGSFNVEATVPADETIGDHAVVIYGADGTGLARQIINVASPHQVTVNVTLPQNATLPSDSTTGRVFLLMTQKTDGQGNLETPIDLFGNDESNGGSTSVFGQDVNGLKAGGAVTMRETGDATTGAYGYILAAESKNNGGIYAGSAADGGDYKAMILDGKHSLDDLTGDGMPTGAYNVQAMYEPYVDYQRADGVTSAHLNGGEGGWFADAPAVLTSKPQTIDFSASAGKPLSLDFTLDQSNPAPEGANQTSGATNGAGVDEKALGTSTQQGFQGDDPNKDNGFGVFKEYKTVTLADGQQVTGAVNQHGNVLNIKIQSPALTRFWGRPMYVGANVAVPAGYFDQANAGTRYPTIYSVGHYAGTGTPQYLGAWDGDWDFDGHRDDANAWNTQHTIVNTGEDVTGWGSYNASMKKAGLNAILVTNRDETPFFDDSYLVNSANAGPYGDAWSDEMVGFIDAYLRTIAKPYARAITGGSTGGWISAALAILRPDVYGSAWTEYPDNLDFDGYQSTDLYTDANAFFNKDSAVLQEYANAGYRDLNGNAISLAAPYRVPSSNARDPQDRSKPLVVEYVDQGLQSETALGLSSRSLGQFGIWAAVFGPKDSDGLPSDPFDPLTGQVNKAVAAKYATQGLDMSEVLKAGWGEGGADGGKDLKNVLKGKLHFWVGTHDTWFLNRGVEQLQATVNDLCGGAADCATTTTTLDYNPDDAYAPTAADAKVTTFSDQWADFIYGTDSVHGYNPYKTVGADGSTGVWSSVYQYADILNWMRVNAPQDGKAELAAAIGETAPSSQQSGLETAKLANPVQGIEWDQSKLDAARGNKATDVEQGGAPAAQTSPSVVAAGSGDGAGSGSGDDAAVTSAKAGDRLKATTGTWDDDLPIVDYQWYRDGAPIADATGAEYTVGAADAGHSLSVQVRARSTTRDHGYRASTAVAVAGSGGSGVTPGQPGGSGAPGAGAGTDGAQGAGQGQDASGGLSSTGVAVAGLAAVAVIAALVGLGVMVARRHGGSVVHRS